MDENSKIYVAGHTGMVGSAIVRKLQAEGYKNIITKTRMELDLFKSDKVVEFFDKEHPEYIVLAAAKVGGIMANMSSPVEFLFENLSIEYNIIKTAHEYGAKKLLFLGSSCIYPKNAKQPLKEEYLMTGKLEDTNEAYALSKIIGVKACEYYKKQYGDNFISIMPSNIYGENDNFDLKTSHVMAALIRRMHEAKVSNDVSVSVWGSGNQFREFMYVDDLADAVMFFLDNYNDSQFVNVGTGYDIKIKDLAYKIKEIVGYSGELAFDDTKPDGMYRKVLDVSKLNSLGWKAKITLDEGIELTYRWYLKKNNEDKNNE